MRLTFAGCSLDLGALELRRHDKIVKVEPQVFEVLALLAQNHDRIVPKLELLDTVWGDRFVSDSALTSRIKSARRAVGDTGRDQRVIKTVYGRGYRLVAEVEQVDASSVSELPRAVISGGADVAAVVRTGTGVAVDLEGQGHRALGRWVDSTYEAATAVGVLVGRGSAAGSGLRMFGCVLEALDELMQREEGLLDQLPVGVRSELESCLAGNGASSRPRLFLATREAVVAAATARPVLLAFEDLEFADPDTLGLVDHVARLCAHHPVGVVAAHRGSVRLSGAYERVSLTGGDASIEEPAAPLEVIAALRLVALSGPTFDTMEFRAASGVAGAAADRLLDLALDAELVEPVAGGGYLFSDPNRHTRLVAELAPHRREAAHRATAARLEEAGADPGRVAAHLLSAGEYEAAVPFATAAARLASASEMHREVLRWTEAGLVAAQGDERFALLTLRAASLVARGDPTATQVYREALSVTPPEAVAGLRAGLARAAMLAGDFATATEALEGLEPDGGPGDGPILLAQGLLAFFTGDLDRAARAAEDARELSLAPGAPNRLLDVITLQGMIAHNRGEWFDRMVRELRSTRESPVLASTVFDCHLCVAEYLLYGPTPYAEVVALAAELRETAERSGAERAVAFAACVAGEAELLAGNLEEARLHLKDAVVRHRRLSADSGTAHSLQRLAEVELADGNRAEAEQLAREALPMARWSPLARHLVQRTYGTLIQAAPDPESALATVDEAAEVLDDPSSCVFCQVMVGVPAAIACAEGGRIDEARAHLGLAEASAAMWQGTAWQGAVAEARAVLVRSEGNRGEATRLLGEAARCFTQAGQPLDAARCREAIEG